MAAALEAENLLYAYVAQACQAIGNQETEWDLEKLQKKIIEYLNKAYKGVSGGNRSWEQLVTDFCDKFYEVFWRSLGERDWLDQSDFTACIAQALRAYCPQELSNVPEDQFMHKVAVAAAFSYDNSRYYSWSWQVLKKIVTQKMAQKKVRDAVDGAREEIVKDMPQSIPDFINVWVQKATEMLAASSMGRNPQHNLPQADAVRLFFDMMKEGGGLPVLLVQVSGGMPTNEALKYDIQEAVRTSYAPFPASAFNAIAGKGNGGYGKDGGYGGQWMPGGKGFDMWGLPLNHMRGMKGPY